MSVTFHSKQTSLADFVQVNAKPHATTQRTTQGTQTTGEELNVREATDAATDATKAAKAAQCCFRRIVNSPHAEHVLGMHQEAIGERIQKVLAKSCC